jgi:hypothetical protein
MENICSKQNHKHKNINKSKRKRSSDNSSQLPLLNSEQSNKSSCAICMEADIMYKAKPDNCKH